jgi:hypothetical protein
LKPHAFRIHTAKSSSAQKTAITPVKTESHAEEAHSVKAGGCGSTQSIVGQDRRRSQRVLLRVRASIHLALQGKLTTLDTFTLSVNDNGALIILKQSLPLETRLVLEHAGTKERVACKVSRASREIAEGFQIPIEFDSPAPNFWRIAFPPHDWRAEDL